MEEGAGSRSGKVDTPITPNDIRYIKLGRGGRWEDVSLARGELHFGHGEVPHDLALIGDKDAIRRFLIAAGRRPGVASHAANEVVDFYHLGSDALWATIADDHLWWTFAAPEVVWLGEGESHGQRMRRSIGGWRKTDIHGVPLRIDRLSAKLTSVAGFQQTICRLKAADYLLRRINGVAEPVVLRSMAARDTLLDVLSDAISLLHWIDFETLISIILGRSGWSRSSPIGETQKLVDMVVEQPTLNERAAVQVKSRATQRELEEFVRKADATLGFDRLFFACHSPSGRLHSPGDRHDIQIWSGRALAETVFRVGLVDWIIDKVG